MPTMPAPITQIPSLSSGVTTAQAAKLAAIDLSNLLLGGAAASANASLAILATKTIAVPASGSVWRGLDFQASTLTLAAGGVAPSALSLAYLAAPTITSAAAYTVPVAATLTIEGPPVAGGALTITTPLSLKVISGASALSSLSINTGLLPTGGTALDVTGSVYLRSGGVFLDELRNYTGNGIDCSAAVMFRNVPALSIGAMALTTVSTVLQVEATKTIASAAGAVWDGIKFAASTASITGATGITTATGFNFTAILAPTINCDTAGLVIAATASAYIGGAPIAGTNTPTFTKSYSLWIDSGLPRIDSASANGSVAVVLGAIGPAGASTTVQEWLTIDIGGTTRYIPCF